MLVYRVCSKSEIIKLINNKSFDEIGSKYENIQNNNHSYIPNIFYMHHQWKKHDCTACPKDTQWKEKALFRRICARSGYAPKSTVTEAPE